MVNFVPFPSIEGFHNVVKAVKAYPHITGNAGSKIYYRGKIKLHGTNAGVRIKDGEVVAQSRTQLITPQSDNAGFARWVEENKAYFTVVGKVIKAEVGQDSVDATIFGEWCGPGIMKGTAINQISNKSFVVFAIVVGSEENHRYMIIKPDKIAQMLDTPKIDIGVYTLPWYGEVIEADFESRYQLEQTVEKLNKVVEEVEPCDPWVKQVFGIEGTAEGVVYYPSTNDDISYKWFSDLTFKAKGEKHKVIKTKESVQIDPEVAASIEEFVTMFVTESRLEQGVNAIGGVDIKNVGNFLKWFGSDVFKESVDELEASGLEWEQVNKAVQIAARNWFIRKTKEV